MPAPNPWTPKKLAEINKLIASGKQVNEIAEKFNRSTQALREACKKFDIELPKSLRYWDETRLNTLRALGKNYPLREISEKLGVAQSSISRIAKLHNIEIKSVYRNTPESFHKKYVVDEKSSCWAWTGSTTNDGYGHFYILGKSWLAHRYSWFLSNGDVPKELDHLCRVRNCVNPVHLEPVTRKENMQRVGRYWRRLYQTASAVTSDPSEENIQRLRDAL